MIAAIAGTHTAIRYVFADGRLSPTARNTAENAAVRGGHGLYRIFLGRPYILSWPKIFRFPGIARYGGMPEMQN